MKSNIKTKAKLVLESLFESKIVMSLLEDLTGPQVRYWALFAHFYEKGFSKLKDKTKLKKLHHKLLQQPRQDMRDAVNYFYSHRKKELGIHEAAGLPKTVDAVKNAKKVKPPSDTKKAKEYFKHHTLHNGPHITGVEAEHATYDFDDDDYEVDGGIQAREPGQKRGYEPVKKIPKTNTKKLKEADTTIDSPGTKGYAAFLTDADLPKQRKSLKTSIEKTTGYVMIQELRKLIRKELGSMLIKGIK